MPNFTKLSNHLKAFTSLHVSLWSNLRKYLLLSGSSCAETVLWQKLLISAPFYEKWLEHLIFVNLNHITYLSTILSCFRFVNQEDKAFNENFIATPH